METTTSANGTELPEIAILFATASLLVGGLLTAALWPRYGWTVALAGGLVFVLSRATLYAAQESRSSVVGDALWYAGTSGSIGSLAVILASGATLVTTADRAFGLACLGFGIGFIVAGWLQLNKQFHTADVVLAVASILIGMAAMGGAAAVPTGVNDGPRLIGLVCAMLAVAVSLDHVTSASEVTGTVGALSAIAALGVGVYLISSATVAVGIAAVALGTVALMIRLARVPASIISIVLGCLVLMVALAAFSRGAPAVASTVLMVGIAAIGGGLASRPRQRAVETPAGEPLVPPLRRQSDRVIELDLTDQPATWADEAVGAPESDV